MKTQCNRVRDNLDRLLDGDLPDAERTELTAHLEVCPECRKELNDQQQAAMELAELPSLTCPDHVVRQIEENTAIPNPGISLADRLRGLVDSLRWRPLAAALPIVVVILLVALLNPTKKAPDSPTHSEEEVQKAKKQASWTLSYVAQTINNAQDKTVEELVRESLRSMIRTRLRDAVQKTEGDNS
jgi:anti-sigma factor RsiW